MSEQLLSLCALSGYFFLPRWLEPGSLSARFLWWSGLFVLRRCCGPCGAARACGLLRGGGGVGTGDGTSLFFKKPHRVVGLAVNFLWAMRNSQHFHTKKESILVIKPGSHIHLFLSFMVQIHGAGVAGCILYVEAATQNRRNQSLVPIYIVVCV